MPVIVWGGAVGVLAAAKDDRIKFLISLAGMVSTEKFYDTEFREETPDTGCMWDEPDCPLSSAFENDLKGIHSTAPQAAQVTVPWLLVHGTEDDVVLICLLYTSPSPRDGLLSRMPSSA